MKIVRNIYSGKFRSQRANNLRDNPERRDIACWGIVCDDGSPFMGGLIAGGNISWTSDYARFKRRIDAQEWLDNYLKKLKFLLD